jgi:hypothetical protein
LALSDSRRAPVIVVQADENWERDNFPRSFLLSLGWGLAWNFLFDPLVWTGTVEERNIFFDHPKQMTLLQDKHVIKTFSPYASQESFADRFDFRRATWRFQDFNSASCCHTRESLTIFAITISNQEVWRLTEWSSLAQFLRDPGIGRMSGDANVNDSP